MDLNGKRLLVTPASFSRAMELQGAVGEALKGSKLDFGGLSKLSLETEIEDMGGFMGTLADMVLSVITSKRVENALFECCESVVHGEEKVNRDFFEVVDHRELYYPIMIEVVKANLGPFFKRLDFLFSGAGGNLLGFLKSKSKPTN